MIQVPEKESDDDFGIVKQWRGRKMHMKKPNMRKDNQPSAEERAGRVVGDSEQPKRKRATRSKNVAVARPVLKAKGKNIGKGKGTGKENTENKENVGGRSARGTGTKVDRGGGGSGGKKRKSLVMPKNWSDSESAKDQSQSDASSYMGAVTAKKRKVTKTGGTGTAKITAAAAAKPTSKPRPKNPVMPKPKAMPKAKAKTSTKVVRKSTPQPRVSLSSTPEGSQGSDAESASSEDSALVNIRRQLQERALKKLMTEGQEEEGNQSTDDDSEAEANVGAIERGGSGEGTPAQQQSTADSESDEEEMIDWQDVKIRAKTKGRGRGSGSGTKTRRSEPGMQLKPL